MKRHLLVLLLLGLPGLAMSADLDGDGREEGELDCDDTDPTIYLNAPEICDDGIDQSCSGSDRLSDADGDGYTILACVPDNPEPDCDDDDPAVSPGAEELCNGEDDNCDGVVLPEELDGDGDGDSVCTGDCDDDDPAEQVDGRESSPTACDDGLDNDCDGAIDGDDEGCWRSPQALGGARIQTVFAGEATLLLDGSASFDPNPDDALAWSWEFGPIEGTDSSDASLVPDGAQAEFTLTPSEEGPWGYEVTLTVTDPQGASDATRWTLVFVRESIGEASSGGAGCSHGGAGAPTAFVICLALLALASGVRTPIPLLLLLAGCGGGAPDLAQDTDHDGVSDLEDCEDRHDGIYPGAPDVYGDLVDSDCDGADGIDRDNDGYPLAGPGAPSERIDCDDADPAVHPDAPEGYLDGVDSDCDGADSLGGSAQDEQAPDAPEVPRDGFTVERPPWDEVQDLGTLSGGADVLVGSISSFGVEDWSGDSDAYQFDVPFQAAVAVRLSWEGDADLDLSAWCYYYDSANPADWYSVFVAPDGGTLADTTNPERGETVVPLQSGAVCQIGVLGYSGAAPLSYTLEVGPLP